MGGDLEPRLTPKPVIKGCPIASTIQTNKQTNKTFILGLRKEKTRE